MQGVWLVLALLWQELLHAQFALLEHTAQHRLHNACHVQQALTTQDKAQTSAQIAPWARTSLEQGRFTLAFANGVLLVATALCWVLHNALCVQKACTTSWSGKQCALYVLLADTRQRQVLQLLLTVCHVLLVATALRRGLCCALRVRQGDTMPAVPLQQLAFYVVQVTT